MKKRQLLIDTNVVIRSFYDRALDHRFLVYQLMGKQGLISVATYAEVMTRATSQEKLAFQKLLTYVKLVPITQEIAHQAALMRSVSLKQNTKAYLNNSF